MGLWYPLIAWLVPHAMVPRTLIKFRRREVQAIRERGAGAAGDGVFRTHLHAKSMGFLDMRASCGAAVGSIGGSSESVDCRACLRIMRRADQEAQA